MKKIIDRSVKWFKKDKLKHSLLLISPLPGILLLYGLNIMAYFVWVLFFLNILWNNNLKKTLFSNVYFSSVFFLTCFWWIAQFDFFLFLEAFLFFVLIYSLFTFVVFQSYHSFKKRRLTWLSLLIVPMSWYLLLFILNQLRLGSFMFEYAIFIENVSFLTKYIKLIGTTTLLVSINFIFAVLIKNYLELKTRKYKFNFKKKQIGLLCFALIFILALNLNLSDSNQNSKSDLIKVAAIQPNFQQDWNWRYEHSNKELLEKNLELSNEAVELGAKIIVWPEYSIPKDLMKNSLSLEKVKNFSRTNNVNLILGTSKRSDESDLNIALFINSSGEIAGDYVFGIRNFFFYQDVPEHKVKTVSFYINDTEIKVGTIICYEEFYYRFAKNMKSSDADLLVVLSNNQRISGGIWLASLFSKQRAAENSLPLIRSVNTGISQIINQQGKALNALEKNKEGIIIKDIYV